MASSSPSDPQLALREVLFGDLPLAQWPAGPEAPDGEPWMSFAAARDQLAKAETAEAVARYQQILAMPALESRHYLQAWQFLRAAGVQPDAEHAKQVLGVVVEVAVDDGLIVVAGYADGTARYLHQSGGGVVWDRPNDSLEAPINSLLESGQGVAQIIGPWDGPPPEAPPTGEARITMLTPSGRHFGQGDYGVMAADGIGGPVLAAGFELLQLLVALTEQK